MQTKGKPTDLQEACYIPAVDNKSVSADIQVADNKLESVAEHIQDKAAVRIWSASADNIPGSAHLCI